MRNKRLSIIIIILFILLFLLCIYYWKINKENIQNNNQIEKKENVEDEIFELSDSDLYKENTINIEKNSELVNKHIGEGEDIDPWGERMPITEENLKLKSTSEAYSYLLMKQCMTSFYLSKEKAYNILPEELRKYDISNFYEERNSFDLCIDKIYIANVSLSKDFYFVYYRVQNSEKTKANKSLIVKVDKKNLSFAIYPYEYLKIVNYSELKNNDIISLDIISANDLEKNNDNHYRVDDISKDDITCVKDLFERTKFDFKYDLEHLYNLLDNEYKKIRFSNNYDNFVDFVNTNRDKYLNDVFKGYQLFPINNDIQYIAISQTDNHYVFNIINLMNYSVQLDNYTVALPVYSKLYENNMPNVKAKYCINRVIKAINDKNYEFVYAKLNPVQKSNYYQSYNDFVNFVKTYFYEKNTFEYGEYSTISDNVYRYIVNVKDENNDGFIERKFNMTVTLKNNADFEISITL